MEGPVNDRFVFENEEENQSRFIFEDKIDTKRFAFEEDISSRFTFQEAIKKPTFEKPSFGERHPNIYGLYGAALAIAELGKFGHVKYADPYEIKKLWKLSPQEQKRQLLMDTAEDLALVGGEAIFAKLGLATEIYFPRLYKWLSKPRQLWPSFFRKTVQKAEQSGAKVMDLIGKRRAEIEKGILDSEVFIKQFEKEFSQAELEAIPFIRQGIKDPAILSNIGKEELIPIIQKPSPQLLKATEKIGKYYDEAFQFLKENWGDVGFVEDYVTHIWDIPKNRTSEVVNYFATRNPFLKKRTIPTLEEGIKLGLKPKTTNIAELLRIYDQYKIKTVHNMEFANQLKGLVDESGEPLMKRIDKAPTDWITIEHPAMSRAMMVGKTTKQIPKKDTISIINETIEKIKTIERTIPEGGRVTKEVNGAVQKLEKVMQGALESRGMTQGESSAYLGRLKSAYAGAKITEGEILEKVSETTSRRVTNEVFREIESTFPVDIPILMKVPVKVHPEIANEVKIIFDNPFSHSAITAYETINAFTKKSMLTATFFHHFALTEAGFATGIGKKTAKLWNPLKIYRALKTGDYEIFKKVPLAKDAIDHKVTFGALSDVQRGRVQEALRWIERKTKSIPGLKIATKGIRKANDLWDAALWDYYHNSLKLYAYEHNVAVGLKTAEGSVQKQFGRSLTREEIEAVKNEMGTFVNDTFGGQNWELSKLFGNPKVRQMMHWIFLAPDWTVSVLKQAAAPAKGVYKQIAARRGGLGPIQATQEKLAGKALTKQGVLFWAKAGLYFNLIAQAANYHNTKKEYGKGRFTWQNAPGHSLNIFIGKNEDGTEKYLRMGKQFREVMEWGYEPEKKVGAKLSPLLRESMRQITKHDPGSGYPTEFEEMEFFESIPERLKSIAEMPIPFSLRGYVESRPGAYMFTFPTSRGMTNYKTVKLLKEAINDKNLNRIRRVYISAIENELDAESLYKAAKSAVKADITYDNKQLAKEILDELKGLEPDARIDAYLLYMKKGTLSPAVREQMEKLLQKEKKVKTSRAVLDLLLSR